MLLTQAYTKNEENVKLNSFDKLLVKVIDDEE